MGMGMGMGTETETRDMRGIRDMRRITVIRRSAVRSFPPCRRSIARLDRRETTWAKFRLMWMEWMACILMDRDKVWGILIRRDITR